jgi:hypothetical protein
MALGDVRFEELEEFPHVPEMALFGTSMHEAVEEFHGTAQVPCIEECRPEEKVIP